MESLERCIAKEISISQEALTRIVSAFTVTQLKKGEHFLQANHSVRKMAFISSGFLRMYSIADGKEITLWIGSSGKFVTSVASFVFETSNFWNIQALTDCTLYVIHRADHFDLCQQEPKWLEFDNLLLAHAYALLEQKMFSQLHTTATERLQQLLDQEPELFLHVPHQHIASMIGIAPESLSRLRKNIGSIS